MRWRVLGSETWRPVQGRRIPHRIFQGVRERPELVLDRVSGEVLQERPPGTRDGSIDRRHWAPRSRDKHSWRAGEGQDCEKSCRSVRPERGLQWGEGVLVRKACLVSEEAILVVVRHGRQTRRDDHLRAWGGPDQEAVSAWPEGQKDRRHGEWKALNPPSERAVRYEAERFPTFKVISCLGELTCEVDVPFLPGASRCRLDVAAHRHGRIVSQVCGYCGEIRTEGTWRATHQ